MEWKELLQNAIAVALGMIIYALIAKRVPAVSNWDDDWDSTYDEGGM